MSKELTQYLGLTAQLLAIREANNDEESAEEDAILDKMDPLWWGMTSKERGWLNQQGPSATPTTRKTKI